MAKYIIEEKHSSFDEVYDLFDFFFYGESRPASSKDKILQNAEEYLLKGERLFTLAKEKFEKECKNFSMSHIEEELYSLDFKDTKYTNSVIEVLQKFVRKVLRGATSSEDADLQCLLSLIEPAYKIDLAFVPLSMEPNQVHYKQVAKGDQILCLSIKEDSFPAIYAYGLKNHKHTEAQMNRLYRSGDCLADITYLISWLLLLSIGSAAMKEGLVEHKVYTFKEMFNFSGRKNLKGSSDTLLPIEHSFIRGCHITDLDFNFWETFFNKYSITFEDVNERSISLKKAYFDKASQEYYSYDEVPMLFCRDTLIQFGDFYAKEILDCYGYLPYHLFIRPCNECNNVLNGYWARPANYTELTDTLTKGFLAKYQLNHNKSVALKNLRNLSSEYAKSYQTKKNIPQKTIDAMQHSHFNEYFGYVEYDEDVDLSKIKVIEEQFVAFKETYFPFIDATQNAIRFRRLGNHKALGLYYPVVACLCVDIHSPSSLIHEFGHLIDYCYGNLSTKEDFLPLSEEYKRLLIKAMEEDEVFGKTLSNKNSKYNKDYYLIPTEIFARCFELYCKEIKGIKNSLTPSAWGPPYPTEQNFISKIKDYFEVVFSSMESTAGAVDELKVASN